LSAPDIMLKSEVEEMRRRHGIGEWDCDATVRRGDIHAFISEIKLLHRIVAAARKLRRNYSPAPHDGYCVWGCEFECADRNKLAAEFDAAIARYDEGNIELKV